VKADGSILLADAYARLRFAYEREATLVAGADDDFDDDLSLDIDLLRFRLAVSRPEFCVEAVVLTVSTRITDGSTESRRCRRRSAADATASPLTRWLARSVVSGGIGRQVADRGDGPTHREGRPRSSSNHIDELLCTATTRGDARLGGRRHILVVKVPPDVL